MTPARIQTARGEVEYVELGEPGPVVVTLHGAMGGWDQSAILARAIVEPGFRVLALSRPGYLGTPSASGESPEAQADLYAAMLDALGVERAAVVAISGGGPSAIRFALRHAGRCASLVLVSTVGSPDVPRPPLAFHVMTWLARRRWFAARLERPQGPEVRARRAIPDANVRARTLADPVAGPLLRELLASTRHRMADRLTGTRLDIEASRRNVALENVRVPTLVVHGTADRVVPFSRHGAELARRIPGAELLAVDGGDHVAIFTHREMIAPRVRAFLAEHVGQGV